MNRPLGETGLRAHPLGFGGYRIEDGNPVHEDALRAYLDQGGNLIDTSANYADGLSEQLIGRVLKNYPREKIILVTKAGYMQGRNMELGRARNFPETVKYGEDLWHSIHPEFLDLQLKLSTERLQTETVDVFLLHNPEYFLADKNRLGTLRASDYDEFYRRIREAFFFLENAVRDKRIRYYGISSNNFGHPASSPEATKVSRCLSIARNTSADHHFKVVQVPLNLFEPGGALEVNNNGLTVLDFCRKNGIGVLANRPLNAFSNGRMLRLADFIPPGTLPPGPEDLKKFLLPLREIENRFAETFSDSKNDSPDVADRLEDILPTIQSSAHLEHAAGPFIIDPIQRWLEQAHVRLEGNPLWVEWQKDFSEKVNQALENIGRHVSKREQKTSDAIRGLLQKAGFPSDGFPPEPLSRIAVRVLLSLDGLSSVLVGMRRPEYVRDLMALSENGPEPRTLDGKKILSTLGSLERVQFEV